MELHSCRCRSDLAGWIERFNMIRVACADMLPLSRTTPERPQKRELAACKDTSKVSCG